jgi:hypothetical protein
MARLVTINRPDVVDLIEDAAEKLTGGDTTEAVALALRTLLAKTERTGTLFGANPGSAMFHESYDPFAPALDVIPDAEFGREIDR